MGHGRGAGDRPVKELEGINLLELAPVRTAAWSERGERVVVERPKPTGWTPAALFERLACALSVQRMRLDELGSFVWRRLDGRTTVGELAEALRERFGEAAEPAEERLGQLVRLLRRERLLAYPEWDELPDGARMERGQTS